MIIVTRYKAFDGVEFGTEPECLAYEKKVAHIRLVGLTIEQIEKMLAGEEPELAEAVEEIGAKLARARRERGELKRRHSAKGQLEGEPQRPSEALANVDPARWAKFVEFDLGAKPGGDEELV